MKWDILNRCSCRTLVICNLSKHKNLIKYHKNNLSIMFVSSSQPHKLWDLKYDNIVILDKIRNCFKEEFEDYLIYDNHEIQNKILENESFGMPILAFLECLKID
jgi:hypothetical protein